ncbi:MAG: T9SS type A sorting domain-containing protein [Bacteroidetes bacterium]|nr:T9SS type A sorting domain-containing protein [Bacteroidota bacterium]
MKTKKKLCNGKIFLFVFLIFLFAASSISHGQVIIQGPHNSANVTEEFPGCLSCPGSDWLNFSNAGLPDGNFTEAVLAQYPFCFQSNCYHSRGLKASDFAFAIPSTATITGIKAEVLRKASNATSIRDTVVQLMSNLSAAGSNKASSTFWQINSAYESYGDSSDLWGVSWAPGDVNSTGFGFFYKPKNVNSGISNVTAYVDHVRLTVYYLSATGIMEHQSSDDLFSVYYQQQEHAIIIRMNQTGIKNVVAKIYDAAGQLVDERMIENISPGISTSEINCEKYSAGIYLVKLENSETNFLKKIVIDK